MLAALLAAALAAAPGAPASETRARALALLGAFDRPVAAEPLRRLGPEGEAALADIALSDELPVFRARALEALAELRAARAAELHGRLAADARAPATVRRAAVRGMATLAGPRAAVELQPLLADDPDPTVRAAAAEALARAAPAEACAAVRRQAAREPAETRAGFRRALAACERGR